MPAPPPESEPAMLSTEAARWPLVLWICDIWSGSRWMEGADRWPAARAPTGLCSASGVALALQVLVRLLRFVHTAPAAHGKCGFPGEMHGVLLP